MRKPKYTEWETILLDSSAIFSYLNACISDKDERCVFVKRVIDDLNSKTSSKGAERQIYISAITISEMLTKVEEQSKSEKIVKALNAKHVTVFPFDDDVAEYMTREFHHILGTEKLSKIARELSFPEHDIRHGREWIEKDVMILATSAYLNCDVTLTMDKKTMLPIANKLDVFCAILEESQFNCNNKYIFEYQPKEDS